MKMNIRVLVGISAYAAALMLLFFMDFGERGYHFTPESSALASSDGGVRTDASYQLKELRLLNRCIGYIRSNYVDPARIKPKAMLLGALDEIQRTVPMVLYQSRPEGDASIATSVFVTVGQTKKEFEIKKIDDLWEMTWTLKDILAHLDGLLPSDVDRAQIEYSAVNGMLSTLDPHSILMSPKVFADMQVGTSGKFGGLGIMISVRQQELTVVTVMPDTPAAKSGIRPGDKLTQIGEESTVNMGLEDAVDRLRGEVGTKVTIWIAREGWPEPRPFTITRKEIKIESVQSSDLGSGIGYIRIKNFQQNTTDDVKAALASLEHQGALTKGLVLDLRDDPGGLLEQAIAISDLFLEDGTIVSTVGNSARVREEKKATQEGTVAPLPLVVISNSGSASASEIVIGALKNNDRAITIGERTFGKGSVQVLYDLKDQRNETAALKLTIAQYLTPGDRSIQSVGIAPDIALYPVTLDSKRMDLYVTEEELTGERDLDNHLENELAKSERSQVLIRYYEPASALDEMDPEEQEEPVIPSEEHRKVNVDYEIRFAKQLIEAAPVATRSEMLAKAGDELLRLQNEEAQKIHNRLGDLGVAWDTPPRGGGKNKPSLSAKLMLSAPGNLVVAGDELEMVAVVQNTGNEAVYRIRAVTRSDNPLLNNREFVFGKLMPGENRKWSVTLTVPKNTLSRKDPVVLEIFADETPVASANTTVAVAVQELKRPVFAYSYELRDAKGNGDGLVQVGEEIDLDMTIRNIGEGKAFQTRANIRNQSGDNVFLTHGKGKFDEIASEQSVSVTYTFRVAEAMQGDRVEFDIYIGDVVLREYTTGRVVIPVYPPGRPELVSVTRMAKVKPQTELLGGPYAEAPVLMQVQEEVRLRIDAELPDWYRIRIGERILWVERANISLDDATNDVGNPGDLNKATLSMFEQVPPLVEVDSLDANSLLVATSTIPLEGYAAFVGSVSPRVDVMVYRNKQKLFVKSADVAGASEVRIPFHLEVPLEGGVNVISIVARDNEDRTTTKRLTLHRVATK